MSSNDSLRLVKVTHERCDEYAGTTFVLAPTEWNAEDICIRVMNAKDAYLDALKVAAENDPAPPYAVFHTFLDQYPNKDATISEVRDAFEAKKVEYKEWEARQRVAKKRFESFLEEQGFFTLWGADAFNAYISWGHRHGTRIDYSETETDSLPVPIKVTDPEFEEDIF